METFEPTERTKRTKHSQKIAFALVRRARRARRAHNNFSFPFHSILHYIRSPAMRPNTLHAHRTDTRFSLLRLRPSLQSFTILSDVSLLFFGFGRFAISRHDRPIIMPAAYIKMRDADDMTSRLECFRRIAIAFHFIRQSSSSGRQS